MPHDFRYALARHRSGRRLTHSIKRSQKRDCECVGPLWLAVWLTIAGVLLSGIVSVPLRQFLLDLGKLAPNRKW